MIAIPVNEASQVAEARRTAMTIARSNGLDEIDTGRLALVATELGTNLIKHGGGGELLVGAFEDTRESGVEILAVDRGRGIANVASCLVDGYSSAGTQCNGLGAVIRQSNFFDIASWPGVGTAVLARVVNRAPGKRHRPTSSWGAVSVAMPGQDVCGDSWTVSENANAVTLFVADGLGHGQEAAEASVEAVRVFHRFNGHQVATLLDYVHGGLRHTRGAAVSMARFDRAMGQVKFGGIGNVAGALAFEGSLKRMVSMPGTAGHNARKIQSFDYPFQSGLVILNSDGLSTSWSLARYPNLEASHPTLIAAILYRDFGRNRDDTTVLVGKWPAKESDVHP
jgi:anti-sigma regulatory factor (Ser/Thr protein kinase)